MSIVGYHAESGFIVNSLGEVCANVSPESYFNFLLRPLPGVIRVFYNLDYAVAQILKMAGVEKEGGELLQRNGELRIYPENFSLSYVAGKFFSLKYGKGYGSPFASYSDTDQYEESVIEEDVGVKEGIGKAEEARNTGERVLRYLKELGLEPKSLASPVNAFSKDVLERMDLPTVDDVPEGASALAHECCHGGWLEAYQRGHFFAYDLDVNSAYSYSTAQLMDTRKGAWIEGTTKPQGAIYGFIAGEVTIDSPFSPIVMSTESEEGERMFTPMGTWDTVITLAELDFINICELGEFKAERGWWWIPNGGDRVVKPLRKAMVELHIEKDKAEGLQREVIKRVMTGTYGKFRELRRGRMGPLYNPVWAAMVETPNRLEVAAFGLKAMEGGAEVLHVVVDGVVLDKIPSTIKPMIGSRMGQWRLSSQGPAIIVSSGIAGMSGREDKDDFSLNYEKLKALLESDPEESVYVMRKRGFLSVGRAVGTGRWEELGVVEDMERTIDVTYEVKRGYEEGPETGGELLSGKYESEPLDAHLLEIGGMV